MGVVHFSAQKVSPSSGVQGKLLGKHIKRKKQNSYPSLG